MDEIKNGAPGAHTNAADSAAVARGDDRMTTTPITLIEAITQALAWELEHDPSVLVLGEDVGRKGGVFLATEGLQEEFAGDPNYLSTADIAWRDEQLAAAPPPVCSSASARTASSTPRWTKPPSPA